MTTTTRKSTIPAHTIMTKAEFYAIQKDAAALYNMRIDYVDAESISFAYSAHTDRPGWGCEATVYFQTGNSHREQDGEETVRLTPIDISITWSSTGRSLAAATKALAAYQRAINFAAHVQAEIEGKFLIQRS